MEEITIVILEERYSHITRRMMPPDDIKFYSDGNRKRIHHISLKYNNSILSNGDTQQKKICLTFDDTPDDKCTMKILNVLKSFNIKCGFAILGRNIKGNEKILEEIYKQGHTIINHSYLHLDMKKCDLFTIKKEILETENLIQKIIKVKTKIVRPPFGNLDETTVKHIVSLNYSILLWSYNTFDWLAREKEDILDNMPEQIRNGEVFLYHSSNNKEPTVLALPIIIENLIKQGFEIVDIEELFHLQAYE